MNRDIRFCLLCLSSINPQLNNWKHIAVIYRNNEAFRNPSIKGAGGEYIETETVIVVKVVEEVWKQSTNFSLEKCLRKKCLPVEVLLSVTSERLKQLLASISPAFFYGYHVLGDAQLKQKTQCRLSCARALLS